MTAPAGTLLVPGWLIAHMVDSDDLDAFAHAEELAMWMGQNLTMGTDRPCPTRIDWVETDYGSWEVRAL